MISIILPALNEGTKIRKVIRRIKNTSYPHEIIVVDDNSTDNTVGEALAEGVRVLTSSKRGKGVSMREGMLAAKFEIIVYLDADILTYPKNVVDRLAEPIIRNEADFVKSFFDRQAGRVTQLVAKPLLGIFFPELETFRQPLSGMIAVRKALLGKVDFENDYGVDIALLIDIFHKGQRIREVNIGYIKNDMQSLEDLGKMSKQVSRTILQKAARFSRSRLETVKDIEEISNEMEMAFRASVRNLHKMVVVDLDMLTGMDYFSVAAYYHGWNKPEVKADAPIQDPDARILEMGRLLSGMTLPEVQNMADYFGIPEGTKEVIRRLKKSGYLCILISEGFDIVAGHIKNKLGFDYCFANQLLLQKSVVSGEVNIPEYFYEKTENGPRYSKAAVFSGLSRAFQIPPQNIIFMGLGETDIPMLRESGLGITRADAPECVQDSADNVIRDSSLQPALDIIFKKFETRPAATRRYRKMAGIGMAAVTLTSCWIFYNLAKKKNRITLSGV